MIHLWSIVIIVVVVLIHELPSPRDCCCGRPADMGSATPTSPAR